MTKNDRSKFTNQLVGLQSIYRPDKELLPEVIEIYWRVFQDWPIERFMRACGALLKSKTISTFPLPGEIILAEKDPLQSSMAWEHACRAVSKHGPYMHVKFEDYAIHRAIEAMGGWPRFCDCPDNERPFKQREFERLYNLFRDHPKPKDYLALPGLHDDIPRNRVEIPAMQVNVKLINKG